MRSDPGPPRANPPPSSGTENQSEPCVFVMVEDNQFPIRRRTKDEKERLRDSRCKDSRLGKKRCER